MPFTAAQIAFLSRSHDLAQRGGLNVCRCNDPTLNALLRKGVVRVTGQHGPWCTYAINKSS